MEVAEVENVAPSRGGSIDEKAGEVVEPEARIENDDNDCDLKSILKAEEFKSRGIQCEMRGLQEKCHSARAKVHADMLAVVALAERCLDLEE